MRRRRGGGRLLVTRDYQLTTLGLILDDSRVEGSVPMLGDGDAGKTEVEKPTYTHRHSIWSAGKKLPCR